MSGETFLRALLAMPVESAKYDTGREQMYDCTVPIGVDPRSIAQRIMDVSHSRPFTTIPLHFGSLPGLTGPKSKCNAAAASNSMYVVLMHLLSM